MSFSKGLGLLTLGVVILLGLGDVVAILADGNSVQSRAVITRPRQEVLLANLKSDDADVRHAAFFTLMSEHQQLKMKLMEIAECEEPLHAQGQQRYFAVQLLLEFGSREAIPIFIKRIEYRQQIVVDRSPGILNGYACAQALVKMGASALPHIIQYLQNHDPPTPLEMVRRRELQQRLEQGGRPVKELPDVHISDKSIELLGWVVLSIYGIHGDGPKEAIRVIRP